jgi:hypothetical protein
VTPSRGSTQDKRFFAQPKLFLRCSVRQSRNEPKGADIAQALSQSVDRSAKAIGARYDGRIILKS